MRSRAWWLSRRYATGSDTSREDAWNSTSRVQPRWRPGRPRKISFSARRAHWKLGRFRLVKRLPAAAGIGGGSADAAAALTVLAESNGLSAGDERLRAAAAETGADVPVCMFPKARIVSGVGERLGPPVALPHIFAVLVNPRASAPTRDVFEALGLAPGSCFESTGRPTFAVGSEGGITLDMLVSGRNDLQPAALRVAPVAGLALETLSRLPGAMATRMSGSGATCFALFASRLGAATARRMVVAEQPHWWVKATALS
jgi:4-diphosphocytidyl-2-C-methyl-D-erythritol kinase